MLLAVAFAFANNTGSIGFYYRQSGAFPPGMGVVVPADAVRTPEAREILQQVSFDDDRLFIDVLALGATAKDDAACGAGGSTGRLELQALRFSSTITHQNTRLSTRQLDVAGVSRGFVDGPRGTVVDGQNLGVSVGESEPGVLSTLRVQGDTSWALTDCAGKVLQSWTQSDWVSRSAAGLTAAEADALLDEAGFTKVNVVSAIAKATRRKLTRPTSERVKREYYDAGSPELEAAAALLKQSKGESWEAPARVWAALAKAGGRTGAMATYNLALYDEWRGDFAGAAEKAHAAHAVLKADWIIGYAALMDAMAMPDAAVSEG